MSEAFSDSQLHTALDGDEMGENKVSSRKPNILQLNLKEKGHIYGAYMPFIKNGGLFLPTSRHFNVGDEVFILMRLLEDPERLPINAKVVWKTPEGADRRPTGYGFQFDDTDQGSYAKNKIEKILAESINSDKLTYTI